MRTCVGNRIQISALPCSAAEWSADNTLNGVDELMVNVKETKLGQNTRMSFSKSSFPCELPNLVEVQTKSFKWFL